MNYMKIAISAATLHAFTSEMSERKKHLKMRMKVKIFAYVCKAKSLKIYGRIIMTCAM